MDVTVTGRHCQINDELRAYVLDRISKIEKLADRVIRVEVQLSAYGAKRQPDESARAEITLHSKGPVIRAEASANEKTAAFEKALEKLMAQLRKAADRKKVHRGSRAPLSLSEAAALPPETPVEEAAEETPTRKVAGMEVSGDGPLVVREKTHASAPMSLDQALEEMELVGHDFFLFVDAETKRPSVVYRRKAYDYGVIRLDVTEMPDAKSA